MVVAGDATARNSYVTYLSGKLPNVSQSPYITQIMVGGRKPGEGGKCVVVAFAVGSFTNLGHRRREGETEEEEECRARTGKASSGRRQKRWEKSQWQSVSRRRLFSKGILESANRGPSASAAAAYFLPISQAAAGCQNQICHGSSFHSLKRGFLGSNLVR